MTIEQTVEITEKGWLHLSLPPEFSVGTTAKVAITASVSAGATENRPRRRLSAEEAAERGWGFGNGPRMSPHEAIEMACGIAKDCAFSSEKLFEERRKDRDMDETRYRRLFHKDGGND
jgi:hypothetical protein